jgi:hypothetical protein
MARKAPPPAEVESIEQRAPLPEVRIETRRISTLRNAPYNPRRISEAALRGLQSSVERFGLVQPIIVNERTGYIVGGHQRVKALKAAGATDALVVLVDLPDTEERALNLALNSPAIAGEFTEGLGALLDEVQAADAELFDALMFDAFVTPEPTDDEWGDVLGALPEGEQGDARKVSFVLSVEQAEMVGRAVSESKGLGEFGDTGNVNANGNAIARICEMWMGAHG